MRIVLRWAGGALLVAYFLAGLLILFGRAYLMPLVASQKDWVEAQLSVASGQTASIDGLRADWPGLFPHLGIDGLTLRDAGGRTLLHLERIEAEIGWSSLWQLRPQLRHLELQGPTLDLRRDAGGGLHVAGLALSGDASDGGGSGVAGRPDEAAWLLDLRRMVIRNGQIVWTDELRQAPPLRLEQVDFEWRNFLRRHSFGLVAQRTTDAGEAQRIDLRGNLSGSSVRDLAAWRGELYAAVDGADVGTWVPWIDLPLGWSNGRGDLRFWLKFAHNSVQSVILDLQASDLRARLGDNVPPLQLDRASGRLSVRRSDTGPAGYVGEIRRLALTLRGDELPPLDARLAWQSTGPQAGGDLTVDTLDLTAFSALALHLPLPSAALAVLAEVSPRGHVDRLQASWQGQLAAPTHWRAEGAFRQLALAPYRELPGFAGLSGRFAGDPTQGEIHLDSHAAQLLLPRVFAEPRLALDRLAVTAGWRQRAAGLEFSLAQARFGNADGRGEASGHYLHTGQGLGSIDLSARLTAGKGTAVWRYIPRVVNAGTRDWLRAGILAGVADETTLRLQGPLEAFPFADGKQGIFQVKGSIRHGTLHYADGWPDITAIDGDLLFEGVRMRIRGKRGTLMGVGLDNVVAEIAALDVDNPLLTVSGRARGATQGFFAFIEGSPVGAMIDHFTAPMQAAGEGSLDLRLALPLNDLDRTRVDGSYRFADNRLQVLPGLPALTAVAGEFAFSEQHLAAKNLTAQLFGMPLAASVGTAAGGEVRIDAHGAATVPALRDAYGGPWFDHLAGQADWQATIRVRPPGAEVHIESGLAGIASSLPLPFNKSARETWPLAIDGRIAPTADRWTLQLADVAAARADFRAAGEGPAALNGRIAIGSGRIPASSPLVQGLAVALDVPQLDIDAWRTVFAGETGADPQADAAVGDWRLAGIELAAARVRALGRDFHDVRLGAETDGDRRWKIALDGREAHGQLQWHAAGAGRLSGHLQKFVWPAAHDDPPAPTPPADSSPTKVGAGETADGAARSAKPAAAPPQRPPDVDLQIDELHVRDMPIGRVHLAAAQRDGQWQAQLQASNDAAQLSGAGRWQVEGALPQTRFAFNLDIESGERLLQRLGLIDAMRGGSGKLEGELHWPGSLSDFALPRLSGRIQADIGKGQFKQLEPGVGRLLGVLSLQSLPRRITLDFGDIFSQGFAFDRILGSATLHAGVLDSDDLAIRGPAAKIDLSGRIDLDAETQDLRVRVQPAVGESVAVGAMLTHPVVGAVAWLAQKILNDPLDRAFAYTYAVKGNWADPQVEKLTGDAARSDPPPPPKVSPP